MKGIYLCLGGIAFNTLLKLLRTSFKQMEGFKYYYMLIENKLKPSLR